MTDSNKTIDELSRIRAAYELVVPEMNALAATDVLPINLDIPNAVATALGAWPEMAALRTELMAKLQDFDVVQFDKLVSYARATGRAHTMFMAASSPAGLSELGEKVAKAREVLHLDAIALAARGVLDGQRLKELKGPPGYKNMAFDLLLLVEMFDEKWSVLEGKTLIQPKDLKENEELADQLIEAVGVREQAPAQAAEAADRRQRAYTLFVNAYDQARRAISYLRWAQGDVDSIVPSLYAGRGNSNVRRRNDEAAPPATPQLPVAQAPALAPASGSSAGAVQAPIAGLPGGPAFTAS